MSVALESHGWCAGAAAVTRQTILATSSAARCCDRDLPVMRSARPATAACRCSSDNPISLCLTAARQRHRVTSAPAREGIGRLDRGRELREVVHQSSKECYPTEVERADPLFARECVGRGLAGIQTGVTGGLECCRVRIAAFHVARSQSHRSTRSLRGSLLVHRSQSRSPSRMLLVTGAHPTTPFRASRLSILGESDK